ncbi:hypothetical protein GCM10011581_48540 [Saccharopolyspora subtropica]|uniref:Phosphatidic acid phosphatase type 2/haloperoxidase domain-containing protein n=1 Tax=Saccharopolyspora thermophila TaxID=89367 RepID=A0A917NJQ4_9PSEU|nr:phosphatase PAP2 family protein [Saccharopolyspora subtropica]GGJ05754.1 hypothetical protein GCM10011581_48540 [Saccharopolyspora subtropica]
MATRTWPDRAARALTEICAPWVIVVVLPLLVAWQATHRIGPTLVWGLLVAATSSILPMAVIVWGARKGRWEGHHVRNRSGRAVPFAALIALSSAGLALLWIGGAPRALLALDVAMIAALLVTAAITIRWKVSMHAAVAAGAVAVLATTWGPLCWLLAPLVAAIAWSRVRLRAHTPAQVAAGARIGALVGGLLFATLTPTPT